MDDEVGGSVRPGLSLCRQLQPRLPPAILGRSTRRSTVNERIMDLINGAIIVLSGAVVTICTVAVIFFGAAA